MCVVEHSAGYSEHFLVSLQVYYYCLLYCVFGVCQPAVLGGRLFLEYSISLFICTLYSIIGVSFVLYLLFGRWRLEGGGGFEAGVLELKGLV